MARVSRLATPRQQQGAAAIFAAVSLLTLLSAVTLAIDVGRLYNAQRSLQRLANLAAIDGARVRSQCLGPAGLDQVLAEVAASLTRNNAPAGATNAVLLGNRKSGDDGLQYFLASAPGADADSVQVTLKRASPARILPLFAGDDSRTLTARAAAQGKSSATAVAEAVTPEANPDFLNQTYGGLLNGSLSLSGNQLRASADATVDGDSLTGGGVDGSVALPDVNVPQPVLGLLNALLAALDAAGDQVTASAVAAFRDAVQAGRGAVDVLPAELLGLRPGQTYDDVTIPVGNLLQNIAFAVADGEPLTFPINLPEPLGDGVTITVQPGQPGTPSTLTPGVELNNDSTDSNSARASLLRIEIELLNPVTGDKFKLPLTTVVQAAQATVLSQTCARLGQDKHEVQVEAHGTYASFAIGEVGDVTGSGLSVNSLAGLAPVPLFPLSVLGQTVTITAQLDPVYVGDPANQTFCFSGPPFGVAEQCDGSPARVGGSSSDEAVLNLQDGLMRIRLQATLPQGLPPVIAAPVQAAADSALATVSATIAPALSLLAQQIVPMLQAVNLTAGQSAVRVTGMKVVQPEVYAQ